LIADHQIHRYIREKRGRVCNVGLWKHGRHPNYLGEITMWWGVFLMFLSVAPAPSSDWVWGVGAMCITLLFCCISIPLMEGRQLRNKPEYAEYKKNTRIFI
jgi:steroid 5-alpha reductase family enzyme